MTDDCSAWNPGLESELPPAYRKLETIFRPENVTTHMEDVQELAAQTGLEVQELVLFRPERLALHELIIRVTADLLIPEGEDENELGENFRRIARHLFKHCVEPRMAELVQIHQELNAAVQRRVRQELNDVLFASAVPDVQPRGLLRLFRKKQKPQPATGETSLERELRAVATFKERGLATRDLLDQAVFKSLYRVLGGVVGNRGYLGSDLEFLAGLVTNHACNRHCSWIIGKTLAPWLAEAVEAEGYPLVTPAGEPLLISLKGASAAGKSSLRPMVCRMLRERELICEGYATVSPDVWRRLLLDYASLGEAYKYAGRLTGRELVVVDRKLDHHIRAKAESTGSIPHMLVDRFRFDSFSTERIARILHDTYVRHVDTMYIVFVVTPPHETVERGWERGLASGRYKAVEDYLDHSVEAYLGMPKILFKWAAYDHPLFKYEFLDNSVPKGTFPKTMAFGTQKELNIIDCSGFVAIERYQKINIRAKDPGEVYPTGPSWEVKNNLCFMRQCIKRIPVVNFVDQASWDPYLQVQNGRFSVLDEDLLARNLEDSELAEILSELAPKLIREAGTES